MKTKPHSSNRLTALESPSLREPMLIHREAWATHDRIWKGYFEGRAIDTGVTVLFYATDEIGAGPAWHVHPYDEVFIIRTGRARFTVGEKTLVARSGDILLGPAHIPHKYENIGPGCLETTDIHLSPTWMQEDLEETK